MYIIWQEIFHSAHYAFLHLLAVCTGKFFGPGKSASLAKSDSQNFRPPNYTKLTEEFDRNIETSHLSK